MKPFFPDTVLHRYSYNEDGTGVYGEKVGSYTYTDDITVDFQNESNAQVAHEYGVELSDLYKIYLDINTTLCESDELHDDNDNIYTIVGGIQRYPKFHKYQKAHLKLVRRNKR